MAIDEVDVSELSAQAALAFGALSWYGGGASAPSTVFNQIIDVTVLHFLTQSL